MELSFIRPAVGSLLLALPLIWFLPSRPRTILHGIMRTLVLALVIAALMQPVVISTQYREHHAIILDQSASVADAARDLGAGIAGDLVRQLKERGTVAVIQIGGESAFSESAVPLRQGDGSGGSPLGDAIELAASSIPHRMSAAVTLISDGLATDRHWGKAIDQLLDRGIPVHTCDLRQQPDDLFLAGIRSTEVRVGESVSVFVEVIGEGSDLEVSLASGGEVLARSGPIASGGRRRVELQFKAGRAGFIDVTAALTAPPDTDPDPDNNHLDHIVAVQDPVRVLYLGERLAGASGKLSALLGPGFDIESAVSADLPDRVDFSNYGVVMLDDMPARSLPDGAQEALVNAVEDGIGLFHSGGEAAFGDGGYFDTPVAEIMPVELPGDEDEIDPSVGLAIIIDTSGSMGGTRIELAKQIARIAVRRMHAHDRIGIVEFYGNKHWAVPMQPATNKIEIDRAIGRMKAIGGTVLFPAIQEAYYGLRNVNTRFKHIVIITDAGVEDSNYEAMIRRISKDRINLSTILVGQGGHNLFMSDLANWGQGRFYAVGDQFSLVELILKQPSTRKPPNYKRGVFPIQGLGGPGWWGDVDNRDIPPLDGYVEVEVRDGAEVLLEEERNGHPILATWRYGLGRVTVLMTEPAGVGTQRWTAWDEYAEFFGRVLARTAADNPNFDLALRRRHGMVTLTAQRNDRDESLRPVAHLVDSAGAQLLDRSVEFKRYAPDLFEADIAVVATDAVRVVVEATHGRGLQRVADAGGSEVAGETQVDPAEALDLRGLSSRTGGAVLSVSTPGAQAFQVSPGPLSFLVTKVWPWLLLAALAAYLGELLYRRWPREIRRRRSEFAW